MLPHINQQIIAAYEHCELTPEEIAENLELDVLAVKTVLMADSSKFRQAQKGDNPDVSADEAQEMMAIMKSIARDQRHELPGVSFRAARYVYDEFKGRNNLGLNVGNGNVNVVVINQKLEGMKAARERALKQAQKVIDQKVIEVAA